MGVRHLRATAAVILTLLGIAAAQLRTPQQRVVPPNAIEVVVRVAIAAQPPGLVSVTLFRGEILVEQNYCNGLGEYAFHDLRDGTYTVQVALPGFLAQSQEVTVSNGSVRRVQFLLQAEAAAKEMVPDDPVVSARWLATPEKARNELVQARNFRQHRNFAEAIVHALRALNIDPKLAIAQNELGLCYRAQKRNDDAQRAFEQAIKYDTDFLPAYLNLAEILAERKEYNSAAALLLNASKAHPDRGEPFFAMAVIQFQTGHLDRAEQACRIALTRDSSRIPEVHILLSNIYLRRGEVPKAIDVLNAYLEKAPTGAQADQVRATLLKLKKGGEQPRD